MGAFGGFTLTNKGKDLLAKAEAGTKLNFTKMMFGDGSLTTNQNKETLTALISKKMDVSITKIESQSGGKAIIGATLSNSTITTGFYLREIGIFATDPQLGEILYSYGNSGTGAEFIPAGGGADVVEKNINLVVTFGNATSVSATVDSAQFATIAQLDAVKDFLNYMPINGGSFDGNNPIGHTVDGGTY